MCKYVAGAPPPSSVNWNAFLIFQFQHLVYRDDDDVQIFCNAAAGNPSLAHTHTPTGAKAQVRRIDRKAMISVVKLRLMFMMASTFTYDDKTEYERLCFSIFFSSSVIKY